MYGVYCLCTYVAIYACRDNWCAHQLATREIRRQQGFFTVATTCPKCQGSGTMISDPCHKCHGEGRVRGKSDLAIKVPAGIDSGQRLKLSGEGGSGSLGGPSGDLYVLVEINEHE